MPQKKFPVVYVGINDEWDLPVLQGLAHLACSPQPSPDAPPWSRKMTAWHSSRARNDSKHFDAFYNYFILDLSGGGKAQAQTTNFRVVIGPVWHY
jgi:hypothetical protein